tara:strand:- start:980 stop:1768 length:789 start_codon:yes stop_codon:yes gene_type:complete
MSITDDGDYGVKQVGFLEVIWGEGFLSPGGIEEIDLMLTGLNISNNDVLDIGCGCGGAAFHFAQNYNVNSVTGIDVEPLVIKRANELAQKYYLEDKTNFEVVEPGPLAFKENQFDVVFSKDAFLHIPDKESLALEVARVIRPGGLLVASDWMRSNDEPLSNEMMEYIAAEGMDMHMCSISRYRDAIELAGFVDIELKDRNKWYSDLAKQEVVAMSMSPLREKIVNLIGENEASNTIEIWNKMIGVLDSGEHRPGHIRARMPC